MLRAVGVGHAYGSERVLDGVDVEVGAGESVALVGVSGSGKTTLLHVLAGLLRPSWGEVWFDGARVDVLSERRRSALRLRRFGFVFQFGELVAELTVVENVELPLRSAGVARRVARARALEVLEELGVAGHAGKRLGEVSGGQGQRVAVARALVHRPAVVFADEPTGSLDAASAALVLDVLLGAVGRRGAALVVASHDAAVAERADRRVVLGGGALEWA